RAAEVGARVEAVPMVGSPGRGSGLCVVCGQDIGSLLRSPELLRDAHVVAAPRSELRSKHTNAGAAADLVDLVGQVDDVEPDRIRQSVPTVGELMRQAEIDLVIGRDVVAVGAFPKTVLTQAGAVDEGCARIGAVQPAMGVGP